MNASASEPLSQPPGCFVLPMRDMAQMFNARPVDPLSQQLETWRQVKAETLHLLLPDDKASLHLAEQTRHALQRYTQYGLLKSYLDQRILNYKTRNEREPLHINARTSQLHTEMWSAASTSVVALPSPMATFILGMNDVLNSQGYTQAAWWNRAVLQ